MERTTNPSVEVPSDAAIAAAITAISSELSASCTGAAATRPVSVQKLLLLLLFLAFASCAPEPGMNWNREIRKISMIRITNTVPSPIIVFSAAFFMVVAKEYFTSTDSEVGVRFCRIHK